MRPPKISIIISFSENGSGTNTCDSDLFVCSCINVPQRLLTYIYSFVHNWPRWARLFVDCAEWYAVRIASFLFTSCSHSATKIDIFSACDESERPWTMDARHAWAFLLDSAYSHSCWYFRYSVANLGFKIQNNCHKSLEYLPNGQASRHTARGKQIYAHKSVPSEYSGCFIPFFPRTSAMPLE